MVYYVLIDGHGYRAWLNHGEWYGIVTYGIGAVGIDNGG